MLPTKLHFIWPCGFRGTFFFRNRPIRNKNCPWRPCLITDQNEMSSRYRGPPIDVSYQVSVHLAKQFQKRKFLEIDQSEIRITCGVWWPCLLMDRDQMSNLYRYFLPRFGSFTKVVSEEKLFQKSTNQKHKLYVAAMFVIESGGNEKSL